MRRLFLVLTIAIAVATAACRQVLDRLPPNIEIQTADGTAMPVSTLLGRPLVLVFYRHYG